MTRRQAFTLIELLVVISIISLLVAMLLPALASARKSANAVKCASNMRQVTLANLSYAADSRDIQAPYRPDDSQYTWVTLLAKGEYVANPQAWLFPVDPFFPTTSTIAGGSVTEQNYDRWRTRAPLGDSQFACPDTVFLTIPNHDSPWTSNQSSGLRANTDYGVNTFLNAHTGGSPTSNSRNWVPMRQLNRPSSLFWLLEACRGGNPYVTPEMPAGSFSHHTTVFRHQSFSNAAFFDGHAEAYQYTDAWDYPFSYQTSGNQDERWGKMNQSYAGP